MNNLIDYVKSQPLIKSLYDRYLKNRCSFDSFSYGESKEFLRFLEETQINIDRNKNQDVYFMITDDIQKCKKQIEFLKKKEDNEKEQTILRNDRAKKYCELMERAKSLGGIIKALGDISYLEFSDDTYIQVMGFGCSLNNDSFIKKLQEFIEKHEKSF